MKFLIDNIFFISTLSVLAIQLSYWVIDKIKIKKDIKDLEKSMKNLQMDLLKLRTTNHDIKNTVFALKIKLEKNENNNKTD